MCGIVGYIGNNDCVEILLEGLSKLEYRGYDSAGIAVMDSGKISASKAKGRLSNLVEKMEKEGKLAGKCGIGHTRWATHGEPSDINSHPHGNKRVTIVHNGIIENYLPLKQFLTEQGYSFDSDTDTEVVAKLLDYYYAGNPIDTIIKVISVIRGSYALGIMFRDFPDKIYAVRKDSQLVVGISEDGNFIASDVPAILKYTRDYYLIEENEIAELTGNGVKVCDIRKKRIEKELHTADWDLDAAEKGGFEHFMLKEIHEQPNAIRTTIAPRIVDGMPYLEESGLTMEMLNGYERIFIVACGTAMHAGLIGKYIIEKMARIEVKVEIASEFRYRDPIINDSDLVILISQSGETADTLAALKLAKEKGAATLSVVNVKGSSIARESDIVIYTHAGPEISVASTKAYTVQLSIMYLLAFELAYANEKITKEECMKLTKQLQDIPDKIQEILVLKERCQFIASRIVNAESLMYIGRGLDYALSMEGSLKLKEISYIHSESYAAGELKHGTISLITEGMPVIAVATQEDLMEKTISNIKEVKSRGAKVTIICREGTTDDKSIANHLVTLPNMDDVMMPMLALVPMQYIAYYAATLKGCDVDKPRNLAKSVTVE